MKEYDEEYEIVCSYVCNFGLYDRIRILSDIKSFPLYMKQAVEKELDQREMSEEAKEMIRVLQVRWRKIY